MSQDTENFDSLRRLMAIKRHETPPPGYFHDFSREVIVRIKAGESGEDTYGYIWQMSWLQRMWSAFEARPALAGSLGLALCSLMVFGVISADSDTVGVQPVAGVSAEDVHAPGGMKVANLAAGQAGSVQPVSMDFSERSGAHATVASMGGAQPSIFDLVPTPQAEASSLHLALPGN